MNIKTKTTSYVTCFLLGLSLGVFFFSDIVNEKIDHSQVDEVRQGQIRYTNPLLECDTLGQSLSNPLGVSKFVLEELINDKINQGDIDFGSVYFRDLNNGPWLGINEKSEFIGASLLKVPMLVAYLKQAESNPGMLDTKVKYISPSVIVSQYFNPTKEIEPGREYTIKELLEAMIIYSDNNAADLLGRYIDSEQVLETFKALGIGLPDFDKPYPVSVRTYASFFRVLYNASYLGTEMSELALQILSRVEFSKGLRADIPNEIRMAHKFGIREVDDQTGKQLHDCGIIYYPNHPYILCIMTRGNNFENMTNAIKDISKEVYIQIDSQNK